MLVLNFLIIQNFLGLLVKWKFQAWVTTAKNKKFILYYKILGRTWALSWSWVGLFGDLDFPKQAHKETGNLVRGASLVTSPHPAWKMGSATLEKWCWRGRLSAESCASYMDTFLWCVQFHGWIPMASSSGKLMGLWAHPTWYFWHEKCWMTYSIIWNIQFQNYY